VKVTVRPAADTDADASAFAWALNEAMDGFLQTLLGSRYPQIIAAASRIPGHEFSLEHVTLAEVDGEVVGMLSGMPTEAMADGTSAIVRYAGLRIVRAAVLVLAGWPVFLAMSRHTAGEWYLQAIAVTPAWRGLGVGSQLLAFADAKARESGCHRIALDVLSTNEPAIRLYERWGCEREWTSLPAWLLGGLRVQRMSKPVPPSAASGSPS
jgi:hypothetical protein